MRESERGECVKNVAATVREILGGPEPDVSVKTLTITDGILGMTRAANQECGDGTWILADTVATRESRRFQRVPDHANCSWQSVMLRDGPVLMDWLFL